ncbi:MAG: hypothetical protein AB1568_13775 [Thermodesulfobacteriota bacterium]
MTEQHERTPVIIFTRSYRIEGRISVAPRARVTDFLMVAGRFIPVTDVELKDDRGNVLLTTSFLSVNRDNIEVIMPKELTRTL